MHPNVHSSIIYNTIAKIWKQPKCPSMDEWIKKMWYVYIYTDADTQTHTHTRILLSLKKE